jgi:glycosyltransferase involved in cell wall biosynthesis
MSFVLSRFSSDDIADFTSRLLTDTLRVPPPKQAPRISVVIPCYNSARFLERTILSVLNQSYPSTQLIVIDGGSTDGSIDIIRRYEQHISHWVSEKDSGQSEAINKGLKMASGDLVGFQNADDLYLPGAFSKLAAMACATGKAALFAGNVLRITENGDITSKTKFICPTRMRLLHEGFLLSSQAVFWRTDLHERLGYFREDLHHGMELEFWVRALEVASAAFTDRPLGCFRIWPGTKTSEFGDRGTREAVGICRACGVEPTMVRSKALHAVFRATRLARWAAYGNLLSYIA